MISVNNHLSKFNVFQKKISLLRFVYLSDAFILENSVLKSEMDSSLRFFVSLQIFTNKMDNAAANPLKVNTEK